MRTQRFMAGFYHRAGEKQVPHFVGNDQSECGMTNPFTPHACKAHALRERSRSFCAASCFRRQ